MPKHILERIAGPNVVRVQEYVESAGRKEIVKLQRSFLGFGVGFASPGTAAAAGGLATQPDDDENAQLEFEFV